MTANTGLSFVFLFNFGFKSCALGILFAFSIAQLTISGLYWRSNRSVFRFSNSLSLVSVLEQILIILVASENGIDLVVCFGWQLVGNKYWFLSVGFL